MLRAWTHRLAFPWYSCPRRIQMGAVRMLRISKNHYRVAISVLLAALSWLLDQLYGSEVFSWIKPMIPEHLTTLSGFLYFVVHYGPTVLLLAVAAFFFVQGWQRTKDHDPEVGGQSASTEIDTVMAYAHYDVESCQLIDWVNVSSATYNEDGDVTFTFGKPLDPRALTFGQAWHHAYV